MSTEHKQYLSAVTLAAIGVVYGDIGTSPLYTLRECFLVIMVLMSDPMWCLVFIADFLDANSSRLG